MNNINWGKINKGNLNLLTERGERENIYLFSIHGEKKDARNLGVEFTGVCELLDKGARIQNRALCSKYSVTEPLF